MYCMLRAELLSGKTIVWLGQTVLHFIYLIKSKRKKLVKNRKDEFRLGEVRAAILNGRKLIGSR